MEYIQVKISDLNEVIKEIREVKQQLQESKKKNALDETWLDIQDVCQLLHVSKRLLQSWRQSPAKIPFSQYQNKIWFKASDVQHFLETHYIKGKRNSL